MLACLILVMAVPYANGDPPAAPPAERPAVAESPSRTASIGDAAGVAVIYIARRGWHVDIGFDAADLQSPLASLVPEFPGVRYLFFGFGDEHYLLAKHRDAPVMLAALWPGRGMILATGLKSSPGDAFGAVHVITLAVTRARLQAAEDFVQRSFGAGTLVTGIGVTDSGVTGTGESGLGPIRPYARGPYDGSLYFIAKQKYSALHTCNTWVAEVLKAAGLRVHSAGVVFAGQLWSQVRRLEREQTSSPRPGVTGSALTGFSPVQCRPQSVGAQSMAAHGASLLSRQAIARSACSQLQGGLVPS